MRLREATRNFDTEEITLSRLQVHLQSIFWIFGPYRPFTRINFGDQVPAVLRAGQLGFINLDRWPPIPRPKILQTANDDDSLPLPR